MVGGVASTGGTVSGSVGGSVGGGVGIRWQPHCDRSVVAHAQVLNAQVRGLSFIYENAHPTKA
jgi:hypothetical protein